LAAPGHPLRRQPAQRLDTAQIADRLVRELMAESET
jgi:hypothetical protein